MSDLSLKDILIAARKEAVQMRHHYVGVEHLFIALLEMKSGLIIRILEDQGLQPEYVVDAIRRKTGKGGKHRLWVGIPNTPRATRVLEDARKIAKKSGRADVNERDLLVALFRERDNLPIRVLQALGVQDSEKLLFLAQTTVLNSQSPRPFIAIEYGRDYDRSFVLTSDQLNVLRRMFHGYAFIRVETLLGGGYSSAILLVVVPLTIDRREDAPVVVKIDQTDLILDEAQRYETHVRAKLPPLTARLEERPTTPENNELAGLKYTLVTADDHKPRDLRSVYLRWNGDKLATWLNDALFNNFGRTLWKQSRLYRFQVWQEYDWMLPPLLTLEWVKTDPPPTSAATLKLPIRRSRLQGLEYGDKVTIENFIVQKIHQEERIIELAAGHGSDSAMAYRIEIRGMDFHETTFYRGEVVESIIGSIWKTREELLIQSARTLEPDFDVQAETIPVEGMDVARIANPIYAYEALLDNYINGSMSTIHGDLHPGNILIGPGEGAFLIDFAHAREGHTLFDWATLEISLLADLIMPRFGHTWADARTALSAYKHVCDECLDGQFGEKIPDSFEAIIKVREIVWSLLANKLWSEYQTALVFCALRALSWTTIQTSGRRLIYLAAALALHELNTHQAPTSDSETPTPDESSSRSLEG